MSIETNRNMWGRILAGSVGWSALLLASPSGAGSSCPPPQPPTLSLVAGAVGGSGTIDGPCTEARFTYPLGIVVAPDNTLYVADFYGNTIRKISTSCVVSTLAGSPGVKGSQDGTGTGALFNGPTGMAMDAQSNLYVTDTYNNLIRKVTPAGVVTTVAGNTATAASIDGTGSQASFAFPQGIAADPAGNLYVTDTYGDTIRKITPGSVVTTLAGAAGVTGTADGSGATARFNEPTGIVVMPDGDLLIADSHNYTLRLVTADGTTTTFAGIVGTPGILDGAPGVGQLGYPTGMVVAPDGTAFVVDSNNDTIRVVSPSGVLSTLAGTPGKKGSDDGTGTAAEFNYPVGIALDSSGTFYVSDTRNYVIRTMTQAGVVQTLAGEAPETGTTDGVGAAARFNLPVGVTMDDRGTLYVADDGNNTIRKIDRSNTVTTLAGNPAVVGSADGVGTNASFNGPAGLASDSRGNVYVADSFNDVIRVVSPSGNVRTLAGTALKPGSTDGRGTALFNHPIGLTVGDLGDVFVADGYNNIIRRITPAGVVSTVAGLAGVSGSADGPVSSATFSYPMGVAEGPQGELYVADANNNVVRKIWHGVVSTLAGVAGTEGYTDGTGASARFIYPSAISTDLQGNVYVCDMDNQIIRKITPTGVVTTIVGVPQVAGVELGDLPGGLSYPTGVASRFGELVIVTGDAVVSTPLHP